MTNNKYQAYGVANQTATKTRQVVMLFEGIIKHVSIARKAIEENDIELRFNSLQRACSIILGLQSGLDFAKGGNIAELMRNFYSSIDLRLMLIHDSHNLKEIDNIIDELKVMKDAWEHVDGNHDKPIDTPESEGELPYPKAVEEAVQNIAVSA